MDTFRFNSIQLIEIDSYCLWLLQLGKLAKIRLDQMANKLPIKSMDSEQPEKNNKMKNLLENSIQSEKMIHARIWTVISVRLWNFKDGGSTYS